MEKFRDTYRIPSSRASWWDYADAGAYFVTICVKGHACYFGDIIDKRMVLNELGDIANEFLIKITRQFSYAHIGATVVMPNHVHAVIVLDNLTGLKPTKPEDQLLSESSEENEMQKTGGFAGMKNPMLNDNLSRIVRWYKGVCSFNMHKIHADFQWQSRYHDHIIRNKDEYNSIHDYITQNPANWEKDKFYKHPVQ